MEFSFLRSGAQAPCHLANRQKDAGWKLRRAMMDGWMDDGLAHTHIHNLDKFMPSFKATLKFQI